MKPFLVSNFLAVFLLSFSSLLPAAGVSWLGDAPIRYFNEEDTRLMKNALQEALDSNDDGISVEWVNPETGHKGSVTPIDSTELKGLSCRNAKIFNSAGGRTANSTYNFCRSEDGEWKFVNK